MKVLQFTDPHLYGRADGRLRGVQTDLTLRAVMQEAFSVCPDHAAIMVSGDLVQDDAAGYARFRNLFAHLQRPVLCVPGNHDIPDAMRSELTGQPFQIGGNFLADGWQIIMLDSYEAGSVGGRLSIAELERLSEALHSIHDHTLVCLHHHPVPMHSRWLDGIGLANAAEFWQTVEPHPHLRAVVWGHVHQEFEGRRGNVQLFATPSTSAQFRPESDSFALDSRPPAFREFDLLPTGEIRSRVHWVQALAARRAG